MVRGKATPSKSTLATPKSTPSTTVTPNKPPSSVPTRSMRTRSETNRSRPEIEPPEEPAEEQEEAPAAKRRKPQMVKYFVAGRVHTAAASLFKEIRQLQNATENLIPRLPFSRLIRELLLKYCSSDMRIQTEALKALQEAAEIYLTQLFADANRCARHAKRVTLKVVDINLVLDIRGANDPGLA